jgi:hypothetical protein
MDDFIKLLALVGALYSTYCSARKAWRISAELFG